MIADSMKAMRLALGSMPLTLAATGVYALFGMGISAEPVLDEGIIAGLFIPSLIAIMIITYLMCRRAGAPAANEIGSVGAWFGGGLLASLPLLGLMLIYAISIGCNEWANTEGPPLFESFSYVIGAVVALPLTALSTGRAINTEGPLVSVVIDYWKRNASDISKVGFVLLLIPNVLSEMLFWASGLETISRPISIFLAIVGGLFLLAVSVVTAGLSAVIYRNAENDGAMV
jgi:hypothetical protein